MLILTIETATPVERVAVVRDGNVLAELTDTVGRGHTEKLLGAVEDVLGRSGEALADLDAVAVSIGPGRFSGLRVGLATAKGLSAASGVPVVPVPTLDALAESARPFRGLVCPALDARRGEVYAALFRMREVSEGAAGGAPEAARERLLPDSAVPPAELAANVLAAAGGEDVLFLGSGAFEYVEELRSAMGGAFVRPDDAVRQPTPAAMAAIVGLDPAGLPGASEARTLEPVYLRGI